MDATNQPGSKEEAISPFATRRIVHVVRQYAPSIGGLEDVVRNLASQQRDRFEDVKVVTLDRLFTDPDKPLSKRETIDGIEVLRIPYSGSSRYPIAPSVLSKISEADLVHVHAIDFFFDFLALTRLVHRRKLVATTHGGFFHTRKFARLKSVWFNTLTRFSASRYAGLVCCSTSDLDLFQKIASRNTVLIENGADVEKFMAASALRPRKRLLTLGRFSSNKRIDRLVDLMSVLTKKDPAWHLDIAGMESELTADQLIGEATARGLADHIDVHVGLSNDELRKLIGQCSLFVSASEYEGFGLVLIEAMSAGLVPVVEANDAFRAIAWKHPLVHTVDFSDSRLAAERVQASFEDLERNPGLRAEAINSAQEYGWAAKARQYETFYRDILPGRS
ncbi:glycosyltransferase family 4 protein [uncultured Roseibium sp.]|uniref:glycosyltransferase family 4 protein n=1 Tax=uncultured Roseibium sp. TaxID=1936171 RepID=UPI00260AC779|nr:glycosyltransferase family 4 protein [uncultured Roseibium sp.]